MSFFRSFCINQIQFHRRRVKRRNAKLKYCDSDSSDREIWSEIEIRMSWVLSFKIYALVSLILPKLNEKGNVPRTKERKDDAIAQNIATERQTEWRNIGVKLDSRWDVAHRLVIFHVSCVAVDCVLSINLTNVGILHLTMYGMNVGFASF